MVTLFARLVWSAAQVSGVLVPFLSQFLPRMKFLVLLLTAYGLVFPSLGQTRQDRQAVEQVVRWFEQDFNDGRFVQAAAYTTPSGNISTPGRHHPGPRGRAGRGARRASGLSARGEYAPGLAAGALSVPAVAVADAVHRLSPYTAPDGRRHTDEQQRKTYVLVKEGGKWRLTHDQNTIIARP
ncbi:hypothetical protein [Hymenobacter volaticus]|uniref:DUF4440 domain-containing protein n=1 Tax=Hymenobacter volaticus TaxID=2932254 RepID=A0ABY4GG01_9BACT|nr:hypothetical protein [Hymenobacter volaticus]UOQ69900.1 hypothetical protein MUN86_30835 [Hymenobacter volaticus]